RGRDPRDRYWFRHEAYLEFCRSGTSRCTVGAFFIFLILANVFAAYFVAQEHYVYYWDWSGYWNTYLDISRSIVRHPITALRSLIGAVRSNDYNPLPVLPLVPFEWLFGTSRLTYILAITDLFLLPAALVMGVLTQRIVQVSTSKRCLSPSVLATGFILI